MRSRNHSRAWAFGAALAMLPLPFGPSASADDAQPVSGAEILIAAETLSNWGEERDDPLLLMSAARLLVLSGATLEADDPWGVMALLDAAGLATANEIARLQAQPRGTLAGPTRHEVQLPPGQAEHFELTFAANEQAMVEVRLRGTSQGADVDLLVTDGKGALLASDEGPTTGTVGYGAYVEWLPAACDAVTVTVVNQGTAPATIVFLAPPAQESTCAP
ncbi:hypothetical protein [Devosia sp. Root635]|uniref:hypothetical protein n=1 Tax=Devosia sp. Root635 TaxID=1736575 RepID=UPI0006F2E70D|nr:hypothetical protein [Devosia sp. Root635]KRA52988.1 hypothetical protein ASD80_14410 [Devosia sp. Root635]